MYLRLSGALRSSRAISARGGQFRRREDLRRRLREFGHDLRHYFRSFLLFRGNKAIPRWSIRGPYQRGMPGAN